jgi:hypothetical protein
MPTAPFEPVPESARDAREFVRDCLDGRGRPDLDVAVLLVSVLATNAVVGSRLTFTVTVDVSADCIQIAVSDLSAVLPVPRLDDDGDTSGRGRAIVAAEADRWGIDPTPGGSEHGLSCAAEPPVSTTQPDHQRATSAGPPTPPRHTGSRPPSARTPPLGTSRAFSRRHG